jgi:GNAT superfamily N-acetyltransferase
MTALVSDHADAMDALCTDGGIVTIRTISRADEKDLRLLYDGVSSRSRYLRFFTTNRRSSDAYVATLARPQTCEHTALGAFAGSVLVGMAAFDRVSSREAEVSLLVTDTHHHRGIGTLLLNRLAEAARRAGIEVFIAEVLAQNAAAVSLLQGLGLPTTIGRDGPTVLITIWLRSPPDAR